MRISSIEGLPLAYRLVAKEDCRMNLDTEAMEPMLEKQSSLWKRLKKQWMLHLFVGIGMIFLLVFSYTPMFGIIMAFKNYTISEGIIGIFTSKWVGLSHFESS